MISSEIRHIVSAIEADEEQIKQQVEEVVDKHYGVYPDGTGSVVVKHGGDTVEIWLVNEKGKQDSRFNIDREEADEVAEEVIRALGWAYELDHHGKAMLSFKRIGT